MEIVLFTSFINYLSNEINHDGKLTFLTRYLFIIIYIDNSKKSSELEYTEAIPSKKI